MICGKERELKNMFTCPPVFVINLRKRTDRWVEMKSELKKLNVPPGRIHRFDAVQYSPGYKGCTMSHMQVIKTAKKKSLKEIIVMEDDLEVLDQKRFRTAVENRDKVQFDILFLSCIPIEPKNLCTKGYLPLKRALSMSCYIVKRKFFSNLIEIFQRALEADRPHDIETQFWQPRQEWFSAWPPVARQRKGFSDIEQDQKDYHHLIWGNSSFIDQFGFVHDKL